MKKLTLSLLAVALLSGQALACPKIEFAELNTYSKEELISSYCMAVDGYAAKKLGDHDDTCLDLTATISRLLKHKFDFTTGMMGGRYQSDPSKVVCPKK